MSKATYIALRCLCWSSRAFRYRRSSRLVAVNVAGRGRGVRIANIPDTMACQVGSRVIRGPDWKWDDQGSNMEGTIISLVDNNGEFVFRP